MAIEDIKIITSLNSISSWDETIESSLQERLLEEVGREEGFETYSVYAVLDLDLVHPIMVGGVIFAFQETTIWIDALWVAPMFRKKGLGFQLLNHIESVAKKWGCRTIQLNTYLNDAHYFFLACGFEDVAIIPNWKYGLECYLMRRKG